MNLISVVFFSFVLKVKIPSNLYENGNSSLTEFLTTICTACQACPFLITLDPGPDQCATCCAAANLLKRPIKSEPFSPQSSNIKREKIDTSNVSSNGNNITGKHL